ncbi:hypothetical protein AVEN_67635-1, partial [Araneus ventricosus]
MVGAVKVLKLNNISNSIIEDASSPYAMNGKNIEDSKTQQHFQEHN